MIRNNIVYNPVLGDWKFRISKAEGSFLWDEKGRKILDFTSGWNTANLGWNHPEVTEAIINQAGKNTYTPSWTSDGIQEEYAHALISVLPKTLNAVCRETSGTESNEQAIKIARTVTGKKVIIGFEEAYHGSTYGSMSIGYPPQYISEIRPVVSDFEHIPFPAVKPEADEKKVLADCLNRVEDLLKTGNVAAVLCEPGMITGWGSVNVAPAGFLQGLRSLTKEYGALLIFDEVGTGFSRCGALFAFQLENVTPDVLTLAKGMSNGTNAMGACIVNEDIVKESISKAKILSSLGWMPLACAAAKKVLEIHLRDQVWETAATNGEWMMRHLRKLFPETTANYIRGKGMEIGVDFVKNQTTNNHVGMVDDIVNRAFENGLQIIQSDEATIQLMPPLTTSRKDLENGLDILAESVKQTVRK